MHFWNRAQWRLFWQSFWVSLIVLGFLTGFLYLSCGHVQEPVISVTLSSSQPLEDSKTDGCSFSFLGWHTRISEQELEQLSQQISALYRQYGVLIPARWRVIKMAAEYIFAAG